MSWSIQTDSGQNVPQPLAAAVERSEPLWREVVGPSIDEVETTWRLAREPDVSNPSILKDYYLFEIQGEAEGTRVRAVERFEPRDIADESRLTNRFYKLWSRFLLSRVQTRLAAFDERAKAYSGD